MGHRALRQQPVRHRQDARGRATRARSIATRRLLGYADGNVFGSRVQPAAPCSRTRATAIGASSPSSGRSSRSTRPGRSAARFTTSSASTRCTTWAKRSTSSATTSTRRRCRAAGRAALVERHAQRWLFGITSEEHTFRPTPDVPQPLLLPPDRKLVYPWIGWQWIEDDYREMTELNDMGRTEDISLGLNLFASIGFAKRSYGSDRDATLFDVAAEKGWEPGGPGRLLLLETGASTRREDVGYRNSQVYVRGALLSPQSREAPVLRQLERARHRRPRSREPGAARRRQRLARLPDPLPSRREPHDR